MTTTQTQIKIAPKVTAIAPKAKVQPISTTAPVAQKLSVIEFTKKAILKMRGEKYKGLHVVFAKFDGQNFNQLFDAYFGTDGAQRIAMIEAAVATGAIAKKPARGGVMLYLAEDLKAVQVQSAEKALASFLA